jgi:hypothetical protein
MAEKVEKRLGARKVITGTSVFVEAFTSEEVDQERFGVLIKVRGIGVAEIHDNDALATGELPWLEMTDGQRVFEGYGPNEKVFVRGAGMTIQIQQVRVQSL